MSNTYSWKINYFITEDRESFPKLATVANFTLTAADSTGAFSYSYTGNVGVPTEGLDPAAYVPFDQLTEAVAQGWIQTTLGEAGVKSLTDMCDNRITVLQEQAANPPQSMVTRLPWAPDQGWDDKPYTPFIL